MRNILLLLFFWPLCSFCQVDTLIGCNVSIKRDHKTLTHAICEDALTEQAKANAIYNWITTHIALDIKASRNPNRPPAKVEDILRKEMATPDGYALLFTEMCKEAGLEALSLMGYSKSAFFDNGDKFYIPHHCWCAVRINGNWELADPACGAGYIEDYDTWLEKKIAKLKGDDLSYGSKERFKFRYDPEFFMYDPLKFRLTHIPADPVWQLTQSQMPLHVFETGDSVIKEYNLANNDIQKSNASLLGISHMDENQKILDLADRAYSYNGRFNSILGSKEVLEVSRTMEYIILHPETINKTELLNARQKLKKATEYYKTQKKSLTEYYGILNKKNITKSTDAKSYFLNIRIKDRMLMGLSHQYVHKARRRFADMNTKYAVAENKKKGLSADKINAIEVKEDRKGDNSKALTLLIDSINSRNEKMEELNAAVLSEQQAIDARHEMNGKIMRSLIISEDTARHALDSETICRIKLKDNYDDDVKRYSNVFNRAKPEADSLCEQYFAGYDSLNTHFDHILKYYVQFMELYNKTIKDMEKYKKESSNVNSEIASEYSKNVLYHIRCINDYQEFLKTHASYEQDHIDIFILTYQKLEHQLKTLEFMELGEDQRKKKEAEDIEISKSFDERHLETQMNNIIKYDKQLQQLL